MKEEEVYLKPRIVLYHNLISDTEISTIKELATPRFKRATVQNYKTGNLETANYRISKTAWLKEHEHPHIGHIYRYRNLFLRNKFLEIQGEWFKNRYVGIYILVIDLYLYLKIYRVLKKTPQKSLESRV